MGTDDAAGGRLAPETDHPPSLAERPLCRHTPEVGAVCGKAARTALCGGRSAMSVPTASIRIFRCWPDADFLQSLPLCPLLGVLLTRFAQPEPFRV